MADKTTTYHRLLISFVKHFNRMFVRAAEGPHRMLITAISNVR